MSHRDKLLKRLKKETFLCKQEKEGIFFDTKLKILECIDKRVFNKITQKDMASYCNVSLVTIKRFENLEVDKLSLYLKYRHFLEHLPNKKKRKVPSWI